jgi:hypothetical protein
MVEARAERIERQYIDRRSAGGASPPAVTPTSVSPAFKALELAYGILQRIDEYDRNQLAESILEQARRNADHLEALRESLYSRRLPSGLVSRIVERVSRFQAGLLVSARAQYELASGAAKAVGVRAIGKVLGAAGVGLSLLSGWVEQEEKDAGRSFPDGVQGARNTVRAVSTTAVSVAAGGGTFIVCTGSTFGFGAPVCAVGAGAVGWFAGEATGLVVDGGLWAVDRVNEFFD